MDMQVLDVGPGVVGIGEGGSASVEDEAVARYWDKERESDVVAAARNADEIWGAKGIGVVTLVQKWVEVEVGLAPPDRT